MTDPPFFGTGGTASNPSIPVPTAKNVAGSAVDAGRQLVNRSDRAQESGPPRGGKPAIVTASH